MRRTLILAASAATLAAPLAVQAASTDYPVSQQYPAANLKAVSPDSGLSPCSQRLEPAFDAQPDPDRPVQEAIKAAFDPRAMWSLDETMRILEAPGEASAEGPVDPVRTPVIRVNFPQNPKDAATAGETPRAGGGFVAPVLGEGVEHACLSYQMRFPDAFSYTSGGRLPGLYGGAGEVAADEPPAGGFTLRPAWREDGEGEVIEYIMNAAADASYGLSVGASRWQWETGRWHTVEQEVVLNTPGEADGIARVWIDGKPMVEQTDLVWRQQAETKVNGLLFSVFFDNLYWNIGAPEKERIDFSDIRMFTPGPGEQTAGGEGEGEAAGR